MPGEVYVYNIRGAIGEKEGKREEKRKERRKGGKKRERREKRREEKRREEVARDGEITGVVCRCSMAFGHVRLCSWIVGGR